MPTNINYTKPRGTIFSILADGKLHTSVEKDTPNAKLREYETSDGKKGSKWELVADSIEGKIKGFGIYEGDFGKQLQVEIGDGETDVTLFLSTASQYGEDFMKKLPNIKLDTPVKFIPYSFEDEGGKNRKGLNLYQGENKLVSFYHEGTGQDTKVLNGYPAVPEDLIGKKDSDAWKLYFLGARQFLIKEVQKSAAYKTDMPNDKNKSAMTPAHDSGNYPKEEISPLDIPF